MNLAGISVAAGLLTVAYLSWPWGILILIGLGWLYSRG